MITVYKGRNSPFLVKIRSLDGKAYDATAMEAITRCKLKCLGAYADSAAHIGAFDWAVFATVGNLIVDVGMLDFTPGEDETCELIVFDADYPEGRVADVLHIKIDPDTYGDGSLADPINGAYGLMSLADITEDHDHSGITEIIIVGEAVLFGESLYFDIPTQKWKKSKADLLTTMPAARMALASAGADESVLALKEGYIRNDAWNFTADGTVKILYPSGSIAGDLSEIAVSDLGYYSQAVATIINAHVIFFCPEVVLARVRTI